MIYIQKECYRCEHSGSDKCKKCRNKSLFEERRTDTDYFADRERETVGGYYSVEHGHAGYTFFNR